MIQDILTEQNLVIIETTMMIKKFAKVFFIIDFGVILFCLLSANYVWLINTQVAFISSMIISIATFLSYKRSVDKRVQSVENSNELKNDRDKIDEIDDPFDLYSEQEISDKTDFTAQEIKDIIQEEKSKIKQNSIKNTLLSAPSFVSIYRIIGYGVLIFGFFALNNNGLFHTISYLVGLFVVPLSMLSLKIISK